MSARTALSIATLFALNPMTATVGWGFPVDVAEAPGTTLPLTLQAIQDAQESIELNIYEMTSPVIARALVGRILAGVRVQILEEGQPVGGFSPVARNVQSVLIQAMQSSPRTDNRLFEMTSREGGKRRFRFNHGKYAVIDGQRLLLGSENFSPTGHPSPTTQGNRGWEVLVHEAEVTQEYDSIFQSDIDLSAGDVVDMTQTGGICRKGMPGCVWSPFSMIDVWASLTSQKTEQPLAAPYSPWTQPITLEASKVERITSPESSLSGLIQLIDSARHTLDIEQMAFHSTWGKEETSPLLQAVVAAARRGVKVRVLLNDESVFDHQGSSGSRKNEATVQLLNSIASRGHLPLKARIADVKSMGVNYIHNKGALVDGHLTLISSINWNRNSVENNREAAVVLTSPEIHDHYEQLFSNDWKRSALNNEKKQQQHPAQLH